VYKKTVCTLCATKIKWTKYSKSECSLRCGDRHGQWSTYCLGVQNTMWIVKVLKGNYTPTYWFSVLRELLAKLGCSCWSICHIHRE
jgi:hypothetical protein